MWITSLFHLKWGSASFLLKSCWFMRWNVGVNVEVAMLNLSKSCLLNCDQCSIFQTIYRFKYFLEVTFANSENNVCVPKHSILIFLVYHHFYRFSFLWNLWKLGMRRDIMVIRVQGLSLRQTCNSIIFLLCSGFSYLNVCGIYIV